jgi:DNA-binding NtrC family response regulator
VDTRTILATNEDLERSVAEGRFRQDLFYRVHVIRLELPPLRERIADIAMLAQQFVERACQEFHRDVKGITTAAMRALEQYPWPGNIRELENAMQRAVLLCSGTRIDLDLLQDVFLPHPARRAAVSPKSSLRVEQPNALLHPTSLLQPDRMATRWSGMSNATMNKPVRPLAEALEGPEREIILHALESNQWNRHATAEQLGINRTTLYKKMKKLGIEGAHPEPIDADKPSERSNRCESPAATRSPYASPYASFG